MDMYLDSDAHGVYPRVLHTAQRHALDLYVVTKDYLPEAANVHLILMQEGQKNAGAWIVANIARGDICVTGDAGIASSCMMRGAVALSPSGRQWGVDAPSDGARAASETWASSLGGFSQHLETAILANRTGSRGALLTSEFARPGARSLLSPNAAAG